MEQEETAESSIASEEAESDSTQARSASSRRTGPRTPGLAIASLVLGLLSLFCFSVVAGVPAIICGHLAHGRIKRSGGRLSGAGLAVAGFVLGYLSIAMTILTGLVLLGMVFRDVERVSRPGRPPAYQRAVPSTPTPFDSAPERELHERAAAEPDDLAITMKLDGDTVWKGSLPLYRDMCKRFRRDERGTPPLAEARYVLTGHVYAAEPGGSDSEPFVLLEDGRSAGMVRCTFRPDQAPKVAGLEEGSTVTLEGRARVFGDRLIISSQFIDCVLKCPE